MTDAFERSGVRSESAASSVTGWITAAGLASLGAGAVHAAAIGAHAEHRPAAVTFTIVAALQLAWGGIAIIRADVWVRVSGLMLGTAAVGGWLLAKTAGISFIDGLEEAEPIQAADALAAGLALASIALILLGAWAVRGGWAFPAPSPMAAIAVLVAAVSIYGMTAASGHAHAAGHSDAASGDAADGHNHDAPLPDDAAPVAVIVDTTDPHSEGTGHDHSVAADDVAAADEVATAEDATAVDHAHTEPAATVEAVPYDPTKPIDLGGVEGVTPEQQAAAENIISVTLLRLPQWADPAVAEAAGFRSIGDGSTGVEHFVNATNMDDEATFDPDHPESLVYDTSDGGRRLVAAMYMLKRGTPLADAPNIGGPLMQWHTHNNLCYNAQGKVAGLTDADGNCPAGLVKPVETPMIHVWIEAHPCGPFAALEGIGGGVIPEGEERLCDHAHGAHG